MKKLITILFSFTIIIGQNKVGGLTYFDFTHTEDESGFNFKRQYVSVAGSSGENVKYKVVMDFGRTNIGTVEFQEDEDSLGNPIYIEKKRRY